MCPRFAVTIVLRCWWVRSRGHRETVFCGLSECGLVRHQLGRELIRRGTLQTCLLLKWLFKWSLWPKGAFQGRNPSKKNPTGIPVILSWRWEDERSRLLQSRIADYPRLPACVLKAGIKTSSFPQTYIQGNRRPGICLITLISWWKVCKHVTTLGLQPGINLGFSCTILSFFFFSKKPHQAIKKPRHPRDQAANQPQTLILT